MASIDSEKLSTLNTKDTPLRSIIDTPLTDSLVNDIFYHQNNDGSFPATDKLGKPFSVNFDDVKNDLKEKGLNSSSSEEIYRLISTASVLFYFLYHSQKTKFPVDIETIKQFVANARKELEGFSMKDDPIMQTFIDKGELAVKFVIDTREKYVNICKDLKVPQTSWEGYIQHLMGLDKQQ